MSRLERWLLPLVFFGILLIPLLLFGQPGFAPVPLSENRTPRPFPKYSLFWFQKLEQWFNDRFGLRDTFVYYGARLQISALGLSANRNVAIGSDNWLFYDGFFKPGRPMFADFLGKEALSAEQLTRMSDTLRNVQHKLAACGIDFLFVMPPDKQTVYPEKMPFRSHLATRTRADQFFDHLRQAAPEVRALDLRKPLAEAKAERPQELYMRTDTHWNDLGALIGYRAIARQLHARGILTTTARADLAAYSFEAVPFQGGDIATNMLSLPGYFTDQVMLRRQGPPSYAQSVALPPGWPSPKNPEEYFATTNPHGKGTLLLYRDSFGHYLLPYLNEDFRNVIAIARHQVNGKEIRRAAPNLVILQVLERLLADLELPPTDLDQACPQNSGKN